MIMPIGYCCCCRELLWNSRLNFSKRWIHWPWRLVRFVAILAVAVAVAVDFDCRWKEDRINQKDCSRRNQTGPSWLFAWAGKK